MTVIPDIEPAVWPSNWLRLAALIVPIYLAGAALLLALAPNFDNAWLQIAARRIFVEGGSFLTDAFEINPPMAVIAFAPSAWIAHWTGLDGDRVYQILSLTLATIGVLLTRPTFRWVLESDIKADLALALSLFVLIFGATTMFGERDLMSLLLAWPFIVWWGGKLAGWPGATLSTLSIILAVFAAIGFLLKPTMAFVPGLMLLVWVVQKRDWRAAFEPHFMVMLAIAFTYGASIFLFFSSWLPVGDIGLSVYWAFNTSWSNVIASAFPEAILLAAASILIALLKPTDRLKPFATVLVCAGLGFLISLIVQQKGWEYHDIAIRQLDAIVLGVLLISGRFLVATTLVRVLALIAMTIGVLYAPLVAGGLIGWPNTGRGVAGMFTKDLVTSEFGQLMQRSANYGPVMVLATSLIPHFPTISVVKGEWASRAPFDPIAPAAARLLAKTGEERAEGQRLHRLGATMLAEDLDRYKPAIIILHKTKPTAFETPSNIIAFYLSNPHVAARWKNYTKRFENDKWLIYSRIGSKADIDGAFDLSRPIQSPAKPSNP